MAVHKKPADTASNAAHAEAKKKTEAQSDKKIDQKPVVTSDIVSETSERVEVIEEVVPDESIVPKDPLNDFKEKMNKEEQDLSAAPVKKNYMWPILFIFIAALALLIGVFVYRQGFKQEKVDVISPTPAPTIIAEPTKAIDLTKYEIEILNGSGVAGEASRQKTNLEEEGFTISSIGNADNSDYTDTIIKAKKEVDKTFLSKLKTVLESSLTITEENLSDDAPVPVIIILGTKN